MAETRQSFATEIEAPPEACYAAIVDFPSYPSWSSVITSAEVVDRHPGGLARRVAFELDMTIRTVRYTLEYAHEPPRRMTWKLVEGDVAGVEGAYTFEPAGAGRTRTTCEQAVSLGFWIPGPIRRIAEQKALRDSVLEFKEWVEGEGRKK